MSASHKKKLRQQAEAPKAASRAQEEMAKEAQRKRNTVVYTIVGVVVAILAILLLIWDSGVIQRNSAVATIGGEKVTAPQVSYYYYRNDLANLAGTYSQYGMPTPYSFDQDPAAQVITEQHVTDWAQLGYTLDASYVGKTYHDYFLDSALNSLREECALRAAAAEAGYTLSDSDKAQVDAGLVSLDSEISTYLSYGYNFNRDTFLKQTYGSTMTEKAYIACLENAVLADAYRANHFDALADYTAEELDAYYQQNTNELDTFHYYYRAFNTAAESTVDANGNAVAPTEAESAAALAQAQADADAALAQVQGDLAAVAEDDNYTEQKNTPKVGEFHYDWLTDPARKSGDATVIDAGYDTLYLLVFADRYRDDAPTADVRHILVQAKNQDDPATEDIDESTLTPREEAFAQAKVKAQELLDQWAAGEATAESFAALAQEHSADPGSNTNGGLYTGVQQGQMIPNFNDWLFDESRQAGDTGLVQNTLSSTQGWHVMYYQGANEPVWTNAARQALWAETVASELEIVRTAKLDSIF